MQVSRAPADLGVDQGLGARRVRVKHLKRVRAARVKLPRIMALRTPKAGKYSSHVWKASVFAQHSYASTVFGMSPSERAKVRTAFGRSLDGGKPFRCLKTVIAVTVGLDQDPWMKHLQRLITEWILFWVSVADQHFWIRKAWALLLQRFSTFARAPRGHGTHGVLRKGAMAAE